MKSRSWFKDSLENWFYETTSLSWSDWRVTTQTQKYENQPPRNNSITQIHKGSEWYKSIQRVIRNTYKNK